MKVNWKLVIFLVSGAWLLLMIVVSYLSYEHKSPIRIENWRPDTVR